MSVASNVRGSGVGPTGNLIQSRSSELIGSQLTNSITKDRLSSQKAKDTDLLISLSSIEMIE